MAVGDLYRVSFNQQVHNVNVANVFHFEQTGVSSDDVPQLIQAFLDTFVTLYQQYCAIEWRPLCVKAQRIKPTEGSARLGLIPLGNDGLALGECMPANQVGVISLYTALYGKKTRGRHFISGATEQWEVRNNHNNGGLVNLQMIADALVAQLVATVPDGTWQAAVYSQTDGTWQLVTAQESRSPFKKLRGRTARIC